jgi:hypothetical protein
LNRVSEEQVSGVSLSGKKDKKRGICNQNFTAEIETQLQNHHLFSKVFPRSSTKPECQKNSQWKKKWQKPKENSLPKITSTKHPQHRQTHPKPQKRKKEKKTKHTHQTCYCFSLEFPSNPNPREKKKQPKTSQRHTETEQELQLGALDL